jgi:hypothetical protein
VAPFAVDDPHETARAIVTLCSSLVEPFASGELAGGMADVIALYQSFARRLVGASPLVEETS